MKVRRVISGRWKMDANVSQLFDLYEKRIYLSMDALTKQWKFTPPHELILRPLYFKNGKCKYNGRAIYHPVKGFAIAMNVRDCPVIYADRGVWVIDHEISHIACALKYNDWTHSENFNLIYGFCRNL